MKRILTCLLLLCLLLTGCRSAHSSPSAGPATAGPGASVETAAPENEGSTAPSQTEPKATIGHGDPITLPTGGDPTELYPVETAGRVRLSYTGNRSSVQYVTTPDQLPDREELKGYDEAYFEDHALLLIVETVGSGSIQVNAEGIRFLGGVATVVLSHELPGDVGTADMATWLLWVELEANLDCAWELENPAFPSEAQTQ